jgi:hypothetical protein
MSHARTRCFRSRTPSTKRMRQKNDCWEKDGRRQCEVDSKDFLRWSSCCHTEVATYMTSDYYMQPLLEGSLLLLIFLVIWEYRKLSDEGTHRTVHKSYCSDCAFHWDHWMSNGRQMLDCRDAPG